MLVNGETKRRDAPRTKARILVAAQQAFAELGYSQAGIRDIAGIAGVDSALLLRYFGSKAKLFEAALIDAIPRFEELDLAQEGFGARLTEKFLEAFLDLRAQSMIALSTSDPDARLISVRVMEQYGIAPLARWLGPPNARARAVRMMMLATGFMLYTRQILLMPPEVAVDNETSQWLAESLQAIIDER